MLDSSLIARRDEILEAARRHGAESVRVLGSATRVSLDQAGDLDLLVSLAPDRSLLDRIALAQELEDLLGMPVDVVNDRAIHPAIRASVLRSALPL